MSSPNADMIAVSVASPKDSKSPYTSMAGLLVSSVRKLLEKVGDLRGIAILVQSNFGIFDIYWSVLNLVKLSRIIILQFWFGYIFAFYQVRKIFLDAYDDM